MRRSKREEQKTDVYDQIRKKKFNFYLKINCLNISLQGLST